MQRVSSNLTVFLKLFIPTAWIVFFGTFTIALFFSSESQLYIFTSTGFKIIWVVFLLMFFFLMFFTIMQLKRVELDTDSYIATNYLQTFKLRYEDIQSVYTLRFWRFIIVSFSLKGRSSLGSKISFLANAYLYDSFLAEHPNVKSLLESLNSKG
ncbi:MAG: hypothetical protein H6567_13280 [Lewinellaceae bacterium]|nr:hypothetical protein [Lewinellaceae bacterium]